MYYFLLQKSQYYWPLFQNITAHKILLTIGLKSFDTFLRSNTNMYVHVQYCNHLQSIAIIKYTLQYYCNISLNIAIFLQSTSKMECGFWQYIPDRNIRLQYIATFLQYIANGYFDLQYIAKKVAILNTDCNENSNQVFYFIAFAIK